MVVVINYSNEYYRQAQILCTATAKRFGAAQVWEYSPQDIPPDFYAAHKFILDLPRGNGYWLWKPLIILDALSKVNDGDHVFYTDSGAAFIDDIHYLIDAMDAAGVNIMTFGGSTDKGSLERIWTKRDAFILMDCDTPEFTDTPQIGATFFACKKCDEAISFVQDWLKYMCDPRIVTDMPNQLGQPNYPEFLENRHDQTVLSLLTKKNKLPQFKTPTQLVSNNLFQDVLERSPYPQIFYHHRRCNWLMTPEECLKLNSAKTTLPRGLECVCILMIERLYSEALAMLLHLESQTQGGGRKFVKHGEKSRKSCASRMRAAIRITAR